MLQFNSRGTEHPVDGHVATKRSHIGYPYTHTDDLSLSLPLSAISSEKIPSAQPEVLW